MLQWNTCSAAWVAAVTTNDLMPVCFCRDICEHPREFRRKHFVIERAWRFISERDLTGPVSPFFSHRQMLITALCCINYSPKSQVFKATTHSTTAELFLGQHCRRWASTTPALVVRLVLAGISLVFRAAWAALVTNSVREVNNTDTTDNLNPRKKPFRRVLHCL